VKHDAAQRAQVAGRRRGEHHREGVGRRMTPIRADRRRRDRAPFPARQPAQWEIDGAGNGRRASRSVHDEL